MDMVPPQALELNPKHPLVKALNQARLNEDNAVSWCLLRSLSLLLLFSPVVPTTAGSLTSFLSVAVSGEKRESERNACRFLEGQLI